jgi:inositol transport system ATP-binding protein
MIAEHKLEMKNIFMTFSGVKALDNVSFALRKGTTHVLCGENGAGKSTLVKILNGIYIPDKGEIYIDGQHVHFSNPMQAKKHKIAMIFQELSYAPDLSLAENYCLGSWPMKGNLRIDWKKINSDVKELLERENLPYSPTVKLRNLNVSDIQILEILKAVYHNAEIVIMDEPTSAITDKEVERLFEKIEMLKEKGVSVIYISHKMDEIFKIANDITVLRDGKTVETRPAKNYKIDEVIEQMVGRKIESYFPKVEVPLGEVLLDVKGFTSSGVFNDISFNLRAGEIVGFSGMMGAGRTEIVRALFGLDKYDRGTIAVNGKNITIKNAWQSIAHKIAMVSEDRRRYGIIPVRSVMENATLSSLEKVIFGGKLHRKIERKITSDIFAKLNVKTPTLDTKIVSLSGGNQQKVILSKWLLRLPDILLLDEPTRGIDVGAKLEIYNLITQMAREGKGILIISSELPELLGMCDRIYVVCEGKITGELDRKNFSQETIMRMAVNVG